MEVKPILKNNDEEKKAQSITLERIVQPIEQIFAVSTNSEESKEDLTALRKVLEQARKWDSSAMGRLEDYASYADNYEIRNERYASPSGITPPILCTPGLIPLPSFEPNPPQ